MPFEDVARKEFYVGDGVYGEYNAEREVVLLFTRDRDGKAKHVIELDVDMVYLIAKKMGSGRRTDDR